jgi:hypothetical protein
MLAKSPAQPPCIQHTHPHTHTQHPAQLLRVSVRDVLDLVPYSPAASRITNASLVYAEINYVTDKIRPMEAPASEIIDRLVKDFSNQARALPGACLAAQQGGAYECVAAAARGKERGGVEKGMPAAERHSVRRSRASGLAAARGCALQMQ